MQHSSDTIPFLRTHIIDQVLILAPGDPFEYLNALAYYLEPYMVPGDPSKFIVMFPLCPIEKSAFNSYSFQNST
jgi:hypothetical protein